MGGNGPEMDVSQRGYDVLRFGNTTFTWLPWHVRGGAICIVWRQVVGSDSRLENGVIRNSGSTAGLFSGSAQDLPRTHCWTSRLWHPNRRQRAFFDGLPARPLSVRSRRLDRPSGGA